MKLVTITVLLALQMQYLVAKQRQCKSECDTTFGVLCVRATEDSGHSTSFFESTFICLKNKRHCKKRCHALRKFQLMMKKLEKMERKLNTFI